MKKITIFIGSVTGGGAERVACELANYLSNNDYKVNILVVTTTDTSYPTDEKVSIVSLDRSKHVSNRYARYIIKTINLVKYISTNKQDAFVVFLPDTIHLFMMFRKIVKCPIILSERNDPNSYGTRVQRWMKKDFSHADGVVFQTESAKKFYAGTMKDNNVAIIPNAIREGFVIDNDTKKKKIILGIGRFSKQKNFQLLIEAYARVYPRFPDYKLVLLGDGALKDEYMHQIEHLGLEGKVEMPGFVKDVKEILASASVYVLSSIYEGIPNSLMEAMALGIPCIATDCDGGGARLLIEDKTNGLLIKNNDVNEMEKALIQILSDNKFAASLGNRAAESLQNYYPQKIYQKWLEFLDSILARKS